jgi:hypothetical protein
MAPVLQASKDRKIPFKGGRNYEIMDKFHLKEGEINITGRFRLEILID